MAALGQIPLKGTDGTEASKLCIPAIVLPMAFSEAVFFASPLY